MTNHLFIVNKVKSPRIRINKGIQISKQFTWRYTLIDKQLAKSILIWKSQAEKYQQKNNVFHIQTCIEVSNQTIAQSVSAPILSSRF